MPSRKSRHNKRKRTPPTYHGYRPAAATSLSVTNAHGRTRIITVRGKQQKHADPADMATIAIMLGRQLRQEADDRDQGKSSEDSV